MVDLANLPKAESVTQLLGDDHRRLDDILAEAKGALAAADVPRAAARFGAFRVGLEEHIVAEEDVLFPLFERLTGTAGGGPTHVMRMEHTEIRTLLAEVADALARGGAAEAESKLARLVALLLAHNGKEERILYPTSDRAARAAGELDALLRRLQAE